MSVSKDPSGLKRSLAAARAEITRLNDALANSATQISDLSTRLGQAEGRLAASEMAGVVEGWRDKCQRMEAVMAEASHPDFIWGALDNVHDAETTLDDYAAAVSRAIRGQMETLK